MYYNNLYRYKYKHLFLNTTNNIIFQPISLDSLRYIQISSKNNCISPIRYARPLKNETSENCGDFFSFLF